MNKTILFALAAAFTCSAAFAQQEDEKWNVYDVQSQETHVVDLANQMIPAAIVGRDDRRNITGRAQSFEKAAVVLEMTSYRGQSFLCSGAMIGPSTVLTAAHCLTDNGKPHRAVRVLATGLSNGGNNNHPSFPPQSPKNPSVNNIISIINKQRSRNDLIRGLINRNRLHSAVSNGMTAASGAGFPSAMAAKMWTPAEWDDRKPLFQVEPYDYGIIILDSNLGDKTGWLNIAAKSAKELQGQDIILLGRGGDKPSKTLWSAQGRIGKTEQSYVYHNADMVGGNSGGPVVLKKDPHTIVALNNFGPANDKAPEGAYPNGSLRISNKIIKAVNANQ